MNWQNVAWFTAGWVLQDIVSIHRRRKRRRRYLDMLSQDIKYRQEVQRRRATLNLHHSGVFDDELESYDGD